MGAHYFQEKKLPILGASGRDVVADDSLLSATADELLAVELRVSFGGTFKCRLPASRL